MIIDLGMHTVRSSFYRTRSAEDQEVGRRVFWAAYVHDKTQSIYQGRPARLRNGDTQVPISFLDEYDELEPFSTLTYSAKQAQLGTATRSVSTFRQLCKLSIVADTILSNFYTEKSCATDSAMLSQALRTIQADLECWRAALPAHLSLVGDGRDSNEFDILPHTLSLMSMFYALIILSSGPSSRTAISKPSATRAIYREHFCLKSCPYFVSYATYVSGTIHVRVAAQRPVGSHAHIALRNCLEVLSEQQEQCHAPRQSLGTLIGLARRLHVDVGKDFTAAMSRSDLVEGCQQQVAVETSMGDGHQGNSSMDYEPFASATGNEAVALEGLDAPSAGFNFDAAIRSFDFAPPREPRFPNNSFDPTVSDRHEGPSSLATQSLSSDVQRTSSFDPNDFSFDDFMSNPYADASLFDPVFGVGASAWDDDAMTSPSRWT
ncbi:hypothetical protein LTR85_006237 [Meristemomyces frigidus]|nr:hypothetical protein LTR85_006237 [Meristemomyces frigidus]